MIDEITKGEKALCIAISEAIDDEAIAARLYSKLSMANNLNREQSIVLSNIEHDERKHHEALTKLYDSFNCKILRKLPTDEEIHDFEKYAEKIRKKRKS